MSYKTQRLGLQVAMDKHILNEFGSKILNEERLDKVLDTQRSDRLSEHSDMRFTCECDDSDCEETIMMTTEEYQHSHRKTKYFIVVASHVRTDLEEVIGSYNGYALVAKFFPRDRPAS